MNIIKIILKTLAKIIHFVPATEEEKIKYAKRQRAIHSYSKSNETTINPSTGLPMIGNLDSMGNSFGSSASDRHHNWNNDYHRHSSTYTSSYDSFTNRY